MRTLRSPSPRKPHRIARASLMLAMAGLVPAVWLAAPALSLKPYVPDPVDFELRGTAPVANQTAYVRAGGVRGHAFRSPVLRTPRRFNLVGLRWQGARSATILVRTRLDGGRWSAWTGVPASDDHAPDRGTAEGRTRWTASDPLWVGEANQLQYRIAAPGSMRGLRLHFVNSRGTATRYDRLRSRLRRLAGGVVRTAASLVGSNAATADTRRPQMVTREQWGASKCLPRAAPSYGTVKLAFVHHTVTASDYSPEDSSSIVLGICRYHRNSNGWNDIGYNFLVDRYGTIFEGRAGGMDQAVVGAQAQGYNSQSTGIANIGTFSTRGQTGKGLEALARVLSWKLATHGIPPRGKVVVRSGGGRLNRFPAGTPVPLNRISGHRDGDATACPGNGLYAQLPQLRNMVPGDGRQPTRLGLKATRSRFTFRHSTRLIGSLQAGDASPLAQQPIEVEMLTSDGRRRIKRATSDASGSFTKRVRPAYNGTVFARFAGNSDLRAAQSTPFTLGVRPQVKAAIVTSARRIRAGRLVFVRGTIRPRKDRALLVVERPRHDGSWRRVTRRLLRVRSGRVRAAHRFRRAGTYRVRLVVKADGKNLGGRSKPLHVAVR